MKTLLLDSNYKPIQFIEFRKLVKLYFNDKIEVLVCWEWFPFVKDIDLPATVRLKKYIRTKNFSVKFSFNSVFQRDNYTCQYTGRKLSGAQLTIDHIVPKIFGGKSTFENCVVADRYINLFKGNRTPEQCGLKLIKKPITPKDKLFLDYQYIDYKHKDWSNYFE